MALDVIRLRQQGAEFAGLLRRMAVHGRVLFETNRIFKSLCLATPCLLVCWGFFGASGGSAGGSAPAPPPIIVGPNSVVSGTAPYQFGSPQAAPDPATVQRQHLFAALYDTLKAEPRAGARCEKLVAAAQPLIAQDRAETSIAAAIADADSCRATVALSDGRFAALSQAAATYQADQTRVTAATLSKAGQAMIGFDHSRELADANQGLFDLAMVATTALQDSDARLKAFFDAKDGAADNAPLDAQTRLVAAAQALTPFDRPGLSPAQRMPYDKATDVAAQFQESDRRIGRAIEQAVTTSVSADAADLIDAVGALTSQDLQRASPTQRQAVDHAREAARAAAFDELLMVSPNPGKTPSPALDEQVTRIRRVIGATDPALISPAQRDALERADQAAARVRASDRRITDMRMAANAWRKSPSPLAGNQVAAAYAGLGDYDRNRFTAADRTAFGQLEDAFYVVSGKSLGLSAATKPKLPLFVVVRDAKGGPRDVLGTAVDDGLVNGGYHLAESRAAAAMIIEITAAIDGRSIIETATASLPATTTSATLRAFWSLDGSEFDREGARANGQGGTSEQAVNASFQRAAKLLADRFDQFVKTGVKP